jgi:nucleoside-diphosphate-sugar epimerase
MLRFQQLNWQLILREPTITVLITGASGFIGRHLSLELVKLGHNVHALLRPRPTLPIELADVTIHNLDQNPESIRKAIQVSDPEVVIHLASRFLAEHKSSDIRELCASNITFGTELVEAMIAHGKLFLVSAGTAWQNFDNRKGVATNLYAATKEAFDSILRYYSDAHGLRAITLKLFDTYGPGDDRSKLMRTLRDVAGKETVLKMSPGEQEIDLLHVKDAARAFIQAAIRVRELDPHANEEYYLRSGERYTLRELIAKSRIASGKSIQVDWGSRPYRSREVMKPWNQGPTLPDWKPQVQLEQGLTAFFKETQDV